MKLSDRLSRLESLILDLSASRSTVSSPAIIESPIIVTSPSDIATNQSPITSPIVSSSPEAIHPIPSLFSLLSSSSQTSFSLKEKKLLDSYTNYVKTFLDTHILQTKDVVTIDYRIIALTLEFISAASVDILLLSGIDVLDLQTATTAAVYLLTYAEVDIPQDIELLIKTFYDIKAKKYVFDSVQSSPTEDPSKKKRYTFISKAKLRWSTMRRRVNKHDQPGCLP